MKGIVLAGGRATRLYPATRVVSKQLLPVYDKPMVYYPLSVLLLAGIREILLISTPEDLPLFQRLLGDGSAFGVKLAYAPQPKPEGLAQAFIIGREFVGDDDVCLILGDNLLFGAGLTQVLRDAREANDGCTLFGHEVQDPERYGVVELGPDGRVVGIEEKPETPKSRIAATGLYFYDNRVLDIAANLTPSARGELEITDVNNHYVREGRASLVRLGRGYAWLDAGTASSLRGASEFVAVLEQRQGTTIACLEEIAFQQGWITAEELLVQAELQANSPYGENLRRLALGL
ncbi:MAG: glucose-1-phosphate thymidylyltransferase RfbA [Deltaproteobacteria bacterium]|nr:glucose-1-phosphate thymidylyltransferase RfbA [Deltaproteobacteria bacterium]